MAQVIQLVSVIKVSDIQFHIVQSFACILVRVGLVFFFPHGWNSPAVLEFMSCKTFKPANSAAYIMAFRSAWLKKTGTVITISLIGCSENRKDF